MVPGETQEIPWLRLPDQALLDLRLCDLHLSLRRTRLYLRVQELYDELERAGLVFRPHVWLSEEWFSPDGVAGFAIPFYLAHSRLARLERSQMLECEGASHEECMRILRHETAHALDNAFGLHRCRTWKATFGSWSDPYPEHYQPVPASRDYVLHLNAWYAQSHPAEDFAETFSVWLADPRKTWKRAYKGWPALAKLQTVDAMMQILKGRTPKNQKRSRIARLSACRTTLREHYRRKREFYEVGLPTLYDPDLLRLFAPAESRQRTTRPRAASFLSRIRKGICKTVAEITGVHHYTVDQLLRRMIARSRQLGLLMIHDEQRTHDEMTALLTTQVVNAAQYGHARIPL